MFFKILENCVVTNIFVGYLSTGKTNLAGKLQNVWEAVPVLCFQNDLSVQSALEVFFSMFFKIAILLKFQKLNTHSATKLFCGCRLCVKVVHFTISLSHPNPYAKQT